MQAYFERLFRSVAWANGRTIAALRGCPAAQADGLPLVAHVLGAEHVWLSRLTGREPALAVWPSLSLDDCQRWAGELAVGWAGYIGQLTDAAAATPIDYRNTRGEPFRSTPADVLTHVVAHGAYHRGQVARAIGQAGGDAVNTDFITFAREGG